MANPKDILVITTSATEGLKVIKHLKPVSAHVVAGTNLFSDFLGGFSDVFGGRSDSYQKQLTSLYNEAIEKIKYNAHEIGANCVIGLSIDMDEISGNGKSMFMLTAIGTAVVIEKDEIPKSLLPTNEKFENVGVKKIDNLRQRRVILNKAKKETLAYDDETWNFITSNQVDEIFPYLIKSHQLYDTSFDKVFGSLSRSNFINYLTALGDEKAIDLLYNQILNEKSVKHSIYLSEVIQELNLFDFERAMILLESLSFEKQKIGLIIATCDKAFYDKKDVENLKSIITFINNNFKERGKKSIRKKSLLKEEKEVWTCTECNDESTLNDIGEPCKMCGRDIFGFNTKVNPKKTIEYIGQKIELINEYLA